MKSVLLLGELLGLTCLSGANLIVNGDFESDPYPPGGFVQLASLTGWTIDPIGDVDGLGAGYLGDLSQAIDLSGTWDGSGSGISQTVSDVDGALYSVSFDVIIPIYGAINFSMDGTVVASNLTGPWGTGTRYTYGFVGAGTDTLDFTSDYGNTTHLDNVDVEPVPEPASLGFLGLTVLGALLRRTRTNQN